MKTLLVTTAIAVAIASGASANSLTDWLSLSPSQRVLCCTSSSSQTYLQTRVWDQQDRRWVSRYVRTVPRHYGADSEDCCEMPTHGDD